METDLASLIPDEEVTEEKTETVVFPFAVHENHKDANMLLCCLIARQIINTICSGFESIRTSPRGYCDLQLHRGCALGRTDTASAPGS